MITMEIGKRVTYDGLPTVDVNKYYYCTDTEELLKRDRVVQQVVKIVVSRFNTPSQGVLYIIDGNIEIFNGETWEIQGTAYCMGTDTIYSTEIAFQEASVHVAAPTSMMNANVTQEEERPTVEDFTDGYYLTSIHESSMITTPGYDHIGLSRYTTNAIVNMTNWEEQEEEITVHSIEELNAIEDKYVGMNVVYDYGNGSFIYQWNGSSWDTIGSNYDLTEYYEDVDYVAIPLSMSMFSVPTLTMTATIAEEEIEAIDYTEFAQISGAAATGIVGSPTVSGYSTETATVAFVAASIAAATQQLNVYVDTLTDSFDPLGSADAALESAIRYVDDRLTWHRTSE